VRGVIGWEHFGQVGAAATNISRRDTARRIFLVELPIRPLSFSFYSRRPIVPAACDRRRDRVPLQPWSDFLRARGPVTGATCKNRALTPVLKGLSDLHRHEEIALAALHEKRDSAFLLVGCRAQLLGALHRRAVDRDDHVARPDAGAR
jgi:hypothetical protein